MKLFDFPDVAWSFSCEPVENLLPNSCESF